MVDNFINIVALEKEQFLLTGLYPLNTPNTIVCVIKRLLIFTFSLLLPISMIIKLLIGVESLEEFADILYYLTTQTAYICKLLNFVYGPGKLLEIEVLLNHPVPYKYYNKFGRKELQVIVKVSDIIALIFRVLIVGILILYAIFPHFDENRELPFAGWFPVDTRAYKWYIYVIQVMCVVVSAITNGNIDLFTIYMISIGIGHLKLIKQCFRNVDYSLRNEKNDSGGRNGNGDILTFISPDDLGELLLFHEHILKYLSMVENLFSYGIFIQFLASIAVVCMTGFQLMITPPQSGQFVLLILYISCMMCQVVMYCWYGNEILYESNEIGESCYLSNWYEGTAADKQILFMVMERSKRQIRLTAGNFFTLSLPTLVMILKSSYSYFAVLQRLYTDK